MGKFISADCVLVNRCSGSQSWFANREKGGGVLRDAAIHRLDSILYFMGYPKPKTVVANQNFLNKELPAKFGYKGWDSYDANKYEDTTESSIEGFVVLDNGASIHIKAASVLNAIKEEQYMDISGEKAGARIESGLADKYELKLLEIEDKCLSERVPLLGNNNPFELEVNHFVECCLNGTECICKPEEAVILMQIIDALYKSADTGLPVQF